MDTRLSHSFEAPVEGEKGYMPRSGQSAQDPALGPLMTVGFACAPSQICTLSPCRAMSVAGMGTSIFRAYCRCCERKPSVRRARDKPGSNESESDLRHCSESWGNSEPERWTISFLPNPPQNRGVLKCKSGWRSIHSPPSPEIEVPRVWSMWSLHNALPQPCWALSTLDNVWESLSSQTR